MKTPLWLWLALTGAAAFLVWRGSQATGITFSDFIESEPEPEPATADARSPVQSTYDLLMRFEGFSPTPYRDARGWSIGYGHYMGPVVTQETISRDDALQLLQNDVSLAAYQVSQAVTVPLTRNQYDALVSLAYNIGGAAFAGSTLVRLLNAGNPMRAADQFLRWNQSQGQVVAALVDRRAQEQHIFLT
jgi:lysozyme